MNELRIVPAEQKYVGEIGDSSVDRSTPPPVTKEAVEKLLARTTLRLYL